MSILLQNTTDNALSCEYCAFTVAIALVWHPWQPKDVRTQWNHKTLSTRISAGQYGSNVNFVVNPAALHQGLFLFKKALTSLSHEIVPMRGRKGVMNIESFMDLPERSKGLDIIFIWVERDATTLPEVLESVRKKANDLLTNSGFRESRFCSLEELAAYLWQQSLLVKPEEDEATDSRRRKIASEMGSKMLGTYGKQINEYVTATLCLHDTDSSALYLEAALKESLKDNNNLDSITKRKRIEETIDDVYLKRLAAIAEDPRVVQSVLLYPKRNIVFTSAEKDLVLCLFDVIMKVIIEDVTGNDSEIVLLAATVTKKVLNNHPIFSELIVGTIERWHSNRGNVSNRPGRKIYQNFEAEIWSRLLIYEFENKVVRALIICIE